MIVAELPEFLIDVGAFFGILGVVIATSVALWRTPLTAPLRWLAGLVVDAAAKWFRELVKEANAEDSSKLSSLAERFEEHRHYVGYHLGPNGETTPIHERLCAVERAVTTDDGRAA